MDRDDDTFGAIDACSAQLAAGPAAPRKAREWLGWLAHHLPSDRLDAARLMVSELVTNAVIHSGLAEGEPIHLSGRADGKRIWVSVCDCGNGFAPDWPPSLPGSEDVEGGRGLWIVHRLADRVLVDGARGRVTFELRRDP